MLEIDRLVLSVLEPVSLTIKNAKRRKSFWLNSLCIQHSRNDGATQRPFNGKTNKIDCFEHQNDSNKEKRGLEWKKESQSRRTIRCNDEWMEKSSSPDYAARSHGRTRHSSLWKRRQTETRSLFTFPRCRHSRCVRLRRGLIIIELKRASDEKVNCSHFSILISFIELSFAVF